jgi:hypothetical protein
MIIATTVISGLAAAAWAVLAAMAAKRGQYMGLVYIVLAIAMSTITIYNLGNLL